MKQLMPIAFVAVLFLLTSCGGSAVKYNNDLVAIEKGLEKLKMKTGIDLNNYFAFKQFDSVVIYANKNMQLIDDRIAEVNKLSMPSAKKAEAIKNAYIEYYGVSKKYFAAWAELGKIKDEDGQNAKIDELEKIQETFAPEVDKLKKVQIEFADANGFKIEKKIDLESLRKK